MKTLVTGGLGFIGSHVVDLLIKEGMDVNVIDNLSTGDEKNRNQHAKYLYKNILQINKKELEDVSYVFHLAALPRIQPSFSDPVLHEKANVLGTIKLMEKLKNNKILKKVVISSSSACYGNPLHTPTNEKEHIAPLSPYALQKYASEQYSIILGERFDIPVISLRYFNVYGPRSFNINNPFNAYTSVIGIFHEQKKNNQKLTITGNGSQERDFIHVYDVANANLKAALSPKIFEIYNVGYGKCYSILEIAKMFNHPYGFIPIRKGEATITLADISKIKTELKWHPLFNLIEGIKTYEKN